MTIASEQLLNHLYYNKLPQVYRDMDDMLRTRPLYRYLSSLIEGGYSEVIKDINNLLDLVDPEKCPEEFLPYLCRSFGLEYFEDIDPVYQRRFLMNIGEIKKRRGTHSCVRYLIRVLTSLDVDLSYKREYNEDKGENGRWLYAELQAVKIEDILQIETSIKVIERFVGGQLPYYITIVLSASVATQILQVNQRLRCAMGQGVTANLSPFKSRSYNLDLTHRRGNAISAGRSGLIAPFNVENYKELRAYSYNKQSLVQDLAYLILPFHTEIEYAVSTEQYNGVCICSGSDQTLTPSTI